MISIFSLSGLVFLLTDSILYLSCNIRTSVSKQNSSCRVCLLAQNAALIFISRDSTPAKEHHISSSLRSALNSAQRNATPLLPPRNRRSDTRKDVAARSRRPEGTFNNNNDEEEGDAVSPARGSRSPVLLEAVDEVDHDVCVVDVGDVGDCAYL